MVHLGVPWPPTFALQSSAGSLLWLARDWTRPAALSPAYEWLSAVVDAVQVPLVRPSRQKQLPPAAPRQTDARSFVTAWQPSSG